MTVARYIILVTALYLVAWAGVLGTLGPGVMGFWETAAMVTAASAFIATVGTWEAMQRAPAGSPRFLLPSLMHGAVILVMLVCRLTV
jgi:hypothetical protein